MHVEEAYATWHFSIILIDLRVEVAQISDFLVHAKILPLWKAFFNLNLPRSTLGKKDRALIFWYLTSHGLFWSSRISTSCWGTLHFDYAPANVITVRSKVLEDVLGLEDTFWSFWPRWLSPWLWPRAFLSLALRGSVLGRAVLGLGFFVSLALASSLVFSTPSLITV